MKSKLTICSLLALSIAFTSCKNEAEAETATTSTTPPEPLIVPRVQAIPSENYVQPNQQVTMPQTQATTQITPQQPVVTKAGMNPAHGQPGHRCDIAVGAPLNSPAGKAATPAAASGKASYTTTTIPTPTSTTSTPQPTGAPAILTSDTPAATAPGMNPPHGQPGHVCGTPVGSPLPKS